MKPKPSSRRVRQARQFQQSQPQPLLPSWKTHWRRYLMVLTAVLVVGGLAYAGYHFRDALFPNTKTWAEETYVNADEPPGLAPEGMVWVPGGRFYMGSDHFKDAQPVHLVTVDGFWMDKTEVTNAQFAKFVKATGYKTYAECVPNLKDFPKMLFNQRMGLLSVVPTQPFPAALPWHGVYKVLEPLEPFSIVFEPDPRKQDGANEQIPWFKDVKRACWRHPEGPGSDLKGRENHPVVHICYLDALVYCKWAGKRLPTEAEWEFAARGGLDRKDFYWGDEQFPEDKCMANIWDGNFPTTNTKEDGYVGTAPVGSFPANRFGLHDMSGNVWEWCSDWYQPGYPVLGPQINPQGPAVSHDPHEPLPKRVQRGGSFLCCNNYCIAYVAGARGKGEPTSAASHIGFRCVQSPR